MNIDNHIVQWAKIIAESEENGYVGESYHYSKEAEEYFETVKKHNFKNDYTAHFEDGKKIHFEYDDASPLELAEQNSVDVMYRKSSRLDYIEFDVDHKKFSIDVLNEINSEWQDEKDRYDDRDVDGPDMDDDDSGDDDSDDDD